VSPRLADDDRLLGDVPIRLYRFRTRMRPRWAARIDVPELGTPEGYGATPVEALRELASKMTTQDLERLRLHTEIERAARVVGEHYRSAPITVDDHTEHLASLKDLAAHPIVAEMDRVLVAVAELDVIETSHGYLLCPFLCDADEYNPHANDCPITVARRLTGKT
jgi:hypothetical protein